MKLMYDMPQADQQAYDAAVSSDDIEGDAVHQLFIGGFLR